MQVSIESQEGLERVLNISVPADRVDSEVDNRVKNYAKKARIDGFRPGKVPVNVIKQKMGGALRDEVVADVIKETVFDAIKDQEFEIAGFPKIDEPKVNEPGKALEYSVKVEVLPEVELKTLEGQEIEKYEAEISDADVDSTIEKMRKQHATWQDADRACQKDDQTVIDFLGKIDGEAFEGGEGTDFNLVLGSGSMIPGFEDGIMGMKVDETKVIDVTFPEEYHSEKLAGKAATFDITLKKVQEPVLPEVNEEFIKKFNSEGTMDEFKAKVRETMVKELKNHILSDYKMAVTDKMVEVHDVMLPQVMIQEEIGRLRNQTMQQFGYTGNETANLPNLPDEMFKSQAEKRVVLGLIMSKVIESKQLKAEPDMVKAKVEELAADYDDSQQVIDWYYGDNKRLNQIEAIVLEEAVIEEMAKTATVKIVKQSYDEVMNHQH